MKDFGDERMSSNCYAKILAKVEREFWKVVTSKRIKQVSWHKNRGEKQKCTQKIVKNERNTRGVERTFQLRAIGNLRSVFHVFAFLLWISFAFSNPEFQIYAFTIAERWCNNDLVVLSQTRHEFFSTYILTGYKNWTKGGVLKKGRTKNSTRRGKKRCCTAMCCKTMVRLTKLDRCGLAPLIGIATVSVWRLEKENSY